MSDFQIFVGLLSVVPLSLASIRLQLTGLVARAHRQTVLHVHPSESDALPVSAMSRDVQLAGTQQLPPLINRMLNLSAEERYEQKAKPKVRTGLTRV